MYNEGYIGKIHPLLEFAITAMNLKERYGIPAFTNLNDMPQRNLEAIQVAMEILSNTMEMRKRQKEMQDRAAEKAGIQTPRKR